MKIKMDFLDYYKYVSVWKQSSFLLSHTSLLGSWGLDQKNQASFFRSPEKDPPNSPSPCSLFSGRSLCIFSQQYPQHTHAHTHTCTDFCPFQRLTLGNAVLLPYRRTDKAIVQIPRLRVHASTCMCACAGACLHFFSSWLPLMRSRWFRARRWSRQAGRVNVMSAAQM